MENNMYIRNKSVATTILLTIFTCGIYYYIWMYQTSEEINNTLGDTGDSGGMEVLLAIVTCGLYGIYWVYKYNQKLYRLINNMGLVASDNSMLCVVLAGLNIIIPGLLIVAQGITQSQINFIADSRPL